MRDVSLSPVNLYLHKCECSQEVAVAGKEAPPPLLAQLGSLGARTGSLSGVPMTVGVWPA